MVASAKITAIEHLSLDGVYQAPGAADEDPRGGFDHGGWATASDTPETQEAIGAHMRGGWSLLVGATTYDGLYKAWRIKQPDSPMGKALTGVRKFVVSRDPHRAVPWENTERLAGEAADTVRTLKATHDKPLIIFGSGQIVRTLMQHGLIDELMVMIHPLLLGRGLHLLNEDVPFSELKPVRQNVTSTGVFISSYEFSGSALR
jgi:dihydrofolate reductase